MSKATLTRRAFLAATTTLAAGCTTQPKLNTARVVPRKISPNEKVNVAGIGAGGKGLSDIMLTAKLKDHVNIVALCDVDWKRAAEGFYRLPKARQYKDYRKMLEEMGDQIDACTISTPDHSHAPAAWQCMMMGKHVRVQKPLTHTIAEARLLANTAKETGVITQMGNQGHAYDGGRDVCEMIWDGAIGEVTEVHSWTNRPIWPQGINEIPATRSIPDTLDWHLWLGPAKKRPYSPRYMPFIWRGWWDFGTGAIGDIACHNLDTPFWALKLADAPSFTVEVVKQEGMTELSPPLNSIIKFEFPARSGMGPVALYWYDGGNVPQRPNAIPVDFPFPQATSGIMLIGTQGAVLTNSHGKGTRWFPKERMADYPRPPQTLRRIPDENSYLDWITGIRENRPAGSDFSHAGPLTEISNMGNVALRAGQKIEYDVASMTITNSRKANQYLTKKYRNGWKLPV